MHPVTHLCDNDSMQRLFLTLDSPAANLAVDEALLDWAENMGPDAECLRVWESPVPIAVLGRSSRVDQEVDRQACTDYGVTLLRRTSGGATIVAGPGCLMYGVVLSQQRRPQLRGIHNAHAYVLDRIAASLQMHIDSVHRAGTSDLAFGSSPSRKFSGNSLRVKKSHLLYHGTLLYNFDLPLISACLLTPPRQPAYRSARDHAEFVANLPLAKGELEAALLRAWPCDKDLQDWPQTLVQTLVRERYAFDDWNLNYGTAD